MSQKWKQKPAICFPTRPNTKPKVLVSLFIIFGIRLVSFFSSKVFPRLAHDKLTEKARTWRKSQSLNEILKPFSRPKTTHLLWRIYNSCFLVLKLVSLLQESSSSWLDSVICHMADIILLEDTPSIQMEVAVLVKEFPDIRWVSRAGLKCFCSTKHQRSVCVSFYFSRSGVFVS